MVCHSGCFSCLSLFTCLYMVVFFVVLFPGGSHIFRLRPGQRCGVWSGWAVSYQTGVISNGPSRKHPLSPRVPAQCYKWPYTVPAHSTGTQETVTVYSFCILGSYGQILWMHKICKYVVDTFRPCKWKQKLWPKWDLGFICFEYTVNTDVFPLSWPQVPIDGVSNVDGGDSACVPMPIHTFCHQISGAEFEQQKLASSQKAMEELLEILLTDQNISERDRRKKLKQVTKHGSNSQSEISISHQTQFERIWIYLLLT